MGIDNWIQAKKKQVGTKINLFKGIKSMIGGDLDKSAIFDLVKDFITPETSREIAHSIASFMKEREEEKNVEELAYMIRRTPDKKSAYVDVLQLHNGIPVATVAQYSENDLANLLKNIENK